MKKKWKRGDINPDTGLFFNRYIKADGKIYENWKTEEELQEIRKQRKRARDVWEKNNPLYYYRNIKNTWQKYLFLGAKRNSKIRNNENEFEISEQWILEKFEEQEGRCYWLDISLNITADRNDPQKPSLDRLDPKLGYSKKNTIISSLYANLGRKDTNEKRTRDFINLIKDTISKIAFNKAIELSAENAKITTFVDAYSEPREVVDKESILKLKI